MNVDEIKLHQKVKVRVKSGNHMRWEEINEGDIGEIVGITMVLVKKPNGDLINCYNHELEEIKDGDIV